MEGLRELRELMLRAPRLTLAVAESVTCGRVQARIGEISGASEFFLGGLTAYALEAKARHLGVERAMAAACDGVSAEVVAQMARGAAALFGADVGVATTGYAEPIKEGGETGDRRPGAGGRGDGREPFAFWAVAWRGPLHGSKGGGGWETRTGKIVCLGATRAAAQGLIADAALAELLAHLRATRG